MSATVNERLGPNPWVRLLSSEDVHAADAASQICRLCVDFLGVSGAGISMASHGGNRSVVCATDDVSSRIEDLQFTLGEGPCVDAAIAGRPVMVADIARADPLARGLWPAFMKDAEREGVRAVFAFPLSIGQVNVGVLDLYRSTAGPLSEVNLAAALVAAEAATLALLELTTDEAGEVLWSPVSLTKASLEVYQATGIVQVQLNLGTGEALLTLKAHAFSSGRRLAEVAADVVAHRLIFSVEDL